MKQETYQEDPTYKDLKNQIEVLTSKLSYYKSDFEEQREMFIDILVELGQNENELSTLQNSYDKLSENYNKLLDMYNRESDKSNSEVSKLTREKEEAEDYATTYGKQITELTEDIKLKDFIIDELQEKLRPTIKQVEEWIKKE